MLSWWRALRPRAGHAHLRLGRNPSRRKRRPDPRRRRLEALAKVDVGGGQDGDQTQAGRPSCRWSPKDGRGADGPAAALEANAPAATPSLGPSWSMRGPWQPWGGGGQNQGRGGRVRDREGGEGRL